MISYSATPANIARSVNTPSFQGWLPTQNLFKAYYFKNYDAPVTPFTATVNILDVIGNPAYSQYSEFKLKALQGFDINNPIAWLSDACIEAPGYPHDFDEVPITSNDMEFTFTAEYINLDLLPVGQYYFNQFFEIYGKVNATTWRLFSTYTLILELNVLKPKCYVLPDNLSYQHIVNTPSETQSVTIFGDSWEVIGRANMELSSSTSGVTVTTYTDTYAGVTGDAQKISGSGPAEIDITLGEIYDVLPTTLAAQLGIIMARSVDLSEQRPINYNVSVLSGPILHVDKTSLDFIGTKGVQEPEPQEVILVCTNPVYTITASPWLTHSVQTRFVDGFNQTYILIQPIATANMSPGTYSGQVQIQSIISGITQTRTITVNYLLNDFIQIPYPANEKAFTLDPKLITLSTTNIGTYMQLRSVIKTYDFNTGIEYTHEINEKFKTFAGIETIFFGHRIHQLMRKFAAVNQEMNYKPAKLKIYCQEKNDSDNSVIRSAVSREIEFYAGSSLGYSHNSFIDINTKMSRVTQNSFAFLNFPVLSQTYVLVQTKNGQAYSQTVVPYQDNACMTKKVTFEDFDLGDVIAFYLTDTTGQYIGGRPNKKEFIVFPEGEHSNHIIWENEGLTQSALECTGEYKIPVELSSISQKIFDQIKESIEIIEVNKSVKLTINTGWLLKSDIDSVDSLMSSKRAWLVTDSGNISLRPSGKQFLAEDSQRELIEYTLEFDINKAYNEETYSSRLVN